MKHITKPKITKNFFKTSILSFQHMFAMLGATVVVPILANLSIPITLITAGIGTVIFYFVTKKKVPVFLGSSFAYLPAMMAIVGHDKPLGSVAWQSAMGGLVIAVLLTGLVYLIFSLIVKLIGVEKVRKIFPPRVVGPVIIVLGMLLVPSILWNNIVANYALSGASSLAWKEWTTALITLLSIVVISAFSKPKSFFKAAPILLGFLIGYGYALAIGLVDFTPIKNSDIVVFQSLGELLGFYKYLHFDWSAIVMMVPLAFVTLMEHIGDISANSTVCKKDFFVDPGIDKTLAGDGLAIMAASTLGGPPQTTYGENTAVLVITENYEPKNIFYAALIAIFFGIFSIFGAVISTIPSAVIGGASIILFGMISASGLRMLIENRADIGRTKDLIVVSITLAVGLGLGAFSVASDIIGAVTNYTVDASFLKVMIGSVQISPLAIATLIAVILNLVIPEPKTPVNEQNSQLEIK
ncbi:MAG TPA: solute carrier family 23 protein [Bacilli bacterium]|nr:solute carrier family 23 protein [Bacilli bacterium]MDD3389485.1 solute carrier family 23 protein [Bacilli bacterium]MDD4345111.1 solute carrier family 23 protein [Bacilli bacterium]MDD4521142.1 solute carrier family 23 protein [Bacilli bacterium]MDY0399858.1 solute carrier family 23 protein [Bacilli bacterium]